MTLLTAVLADNLTYYLPKSTKSVDLIFADYIYENDDFDWVDHFWKMLKKDGIFIAMTDYHTAAEYKVYMDSKEDSVFVNWLIWKNEFGNFPKNKFRQCHDDIIIFSKGKNYKFYPERVQIEKATALSKGLNPSGRTTKIATSVITDICLTTISKERIKSKTGKNVQWQKPVKLIERLITPFVDEGETILDPFMGVGTSGMVAKKLNCNYIGIEHNPETFALASKRISG